MSQTSRLIRPTSRRRIYRTLLASLLVGALATEPVARAADDTDLLREPGATPYVLFLVDTSGSMALRPPTTTSQSDLGTWIGAGADDPGSKIFQTKKALYEVISGIENVHFGLATFNQDELQVRQKHWLYRPTETATFTSSSGNLSFSYPTAVAATDDAVRDESWVVGPLVEADAQLGSCSDAKDLSSERRYLDRFSRLGANGEEAIDLWIEVRQNRIFKMTVAPAGGSATIGAPQIDLDLFVREVDSTDCTTVVENLPKRTITFERVAPFLLVESAEGEAGIAPNVPKNSLPENCAAAETVAGFVNHQDIQATGTCGSGSSHPFTGAGWDSNYDSGARDSGDFRDLFCDSGDCLNLRYPTVESEVEFPRGSGNTAWELDVGDVVTWDWNDEHKDRVLQRLNPRHPAPPPAAPAGYPDTADPVQKADYERKLQRYFGVAPFFENTADEVAGALPLRNSDQRPIIAFGHSPLGRAINDIYCWYLGKDEAPNKCAGENEYAHGWNTLFQENDLFHACQVRHLIVITDSEDNAEGQNFASETTELTKQPGFRATIFSFQDNKNFQKVKSNAGSDVVLVKNGSDLKEKLEEVIGSIEQNSRTFATAAVPSVQSSADQNIYITNFEPRNDHGVWEGHVQAFGQDFRNLEPTDDAFLWDAADLMIEQSHAPVAEGDSTAETDLKVSNPSSDTNRRPFYVQDRVPGDTDLGSWAVNRAVFDRTTERGKDGRSLNPDTSAKEPTGREADFWDGLEIPYDPGDPDSVRQARIRGNRIVERTLIQKQRINEDGTAEDYLLGDIFHFDPLIVGSPGNTAYFAADAEETFDGGGTELGTGYQDFFNRQENRRRVLFAGANDGQLHAFDAGRASVVTDTTFDPPRDVVKYNNGTGREIFAYLPRGVLPTVRDLAESPVSHRWGVDAPASAGDVFIDPLHDGAPTVGDRAWRTVLVGGFREGGAGYYALDVTHPDPMVEGTIGPTGPGVDPSLRRTVQVPEDPTAVVPSCHADGSSCGEDVAYPAPLWEFYDRVWNPATQEYNPLDEDQNGLHDLGETWSKPTIGRMKVESTGGDVVNKYVSVFGGGLDPDKSDKRGNWIYIVDIETGEAIYKRPVEGSMVADAAAVDANADGFLDRIYAATTAGFMYRVDLFETNSVTGERIYPKLVEVEQVHALASDGATVPIDLAPPVEWDRIESADNSGNPLWAPQKIFTTDGLPIYFRPSVIFVANLNKYALAFGTGDRDSLTSFPDQIGRFYLFVDDSSDPLVEPLLPMDESNFTAIDAEDSLERDDLLTDPSISPGNRGWYLVLNTDERVIGNPFGFSGITFFATFQPTPPEDNPDSTTCAEKDGDTCTPFCDLDGTSRVYLVGTTDADAFLPNPDDASQVDRFRQIDGFVTNPFTEQAVTTTSGSNDGSDGSDEPSRDELTEAEKDLMRKLQELFPPNCKFGNHRIDINIIRSEDVALERIGTVPICIIEKNWKEF